MSKSKKNNLKKIVAGAPLLLLGTPAMAASLPNLSSRSRLSNLRPKQTFIQQSEQNENKRGNSSNAFASFGNKVIVTAKQQQQVSNSEVLQFLNENGLLSATTTQASLKSGDLASRKQFATPVNMDHCHTSLGLTSYVMTAISCTTGGGSWHPADLTAPILSAVGHASVTSSAVDISATSNEDGSMYYVITTSAVAPSNAQVALGNDENDTAAFKSGTSAVTAAVGKTFNVTGLNNSTTYYYYIMAADGAGNPSTVSNGTFTTAAAGNNVPTLTSFAAALTTTNEDTEVEITLTAIQTQGDEADTEDGTVSKFVIKAVSSGTLKIGTSSGAATAWAATTNDTVDATNKAYWTPAANANGTLNAFTVVAEDSANAESTPAVQAQVSVTAIADTPSVTGASTNEDTQTTSGLVISRNANDSTEVTHFKITGIAGGALFKNDGSTAINDNDFITFAEGNAGLKFTPSLNSTSSGSFNVQAGTDGAGAGLSGGSATATITVSAVNDAPTLTSFTSVVDSTSSGTEVEITMAELNAQGDEADVDGTVTAYVVQVVSSGTLKIGANAGAATPYAVTTNDVIDGTKNAYWTPAATGTQNAFTVKAKDNSAASSATAVQAQVEVAAPPPPPVNLSATGSAALVVAPPGNLFVEGQLIEVSISEILDPNGVSASIENGDRSAFIYEWTRVTNSSTENIGLAQSAYKYRLSAADVGNSIGVTISFVDNDGFSNSITSNLVGPVEGLNDAPTGEVVIAGLSEEDQNLSADASTIADADGLGEFSYQWLRDDVAIEGAASSSYLLGDDDVGKAISVRISYVDGFGASESLTSAATAAIANVNDAPTGEVVISGSAEEDHALTVSNTLADEDGLGEITYQWLKDGAVLEGVTGESYTLGQNDVGSKLSVVASYVDGFGQSETVTSSLTEQVVNVNDELTGSVIINGNLEVGATLTAENTLQDADGPDPLELNYQWYRGNFLIADANKSSYLLTADDKGSSIKLVVSYTDAGGTDEAVTVETDGVVLQPDGVPPVFYFADYLKPSKSSGLLPSIDDPGRTYNKRGEHSITMESKGALTSINLSDYVVARDFDSGSDAPSSISTNVSLLISVLPEASVFYKNNEVSVKPVQIVSNDQAAKSLAGGAVNLVPGVHVLSLEATDDSGETATTTLTINILPRLTIATGIKRLGPGNMSHFKLLLDGPSPKPVSFSFDIRPSWFTYRGSIFGNEEMSIEVIENDNVSFNDGKQMLFSNKFDRPHLSATTRSWPGKVTIPAGAGGVDVYVKINSVKLVDYGTSACGFLNRFDEECKKKESEGFVADMYMDVKFSEVVATESTFSSLSSDLISLDLTGLGISGSDVNNKTPDLVYYGGTIATTTGIIDLDGSESYFSGGGVAVYGEQSPPAVTLKADQEGRRTSIVTLGGGKVVVTAAVTNDSDYYRYWVDPFRDNTVQRTTSTAVSYSWAGSSNALSDTDGEDNNTFSFDPAGLSPGTYTIKVGAINKDNKSGHDTLTLQLLAEPPELSDDKDSDCDGSSDALEGYGDKDGDGIPDYKDKDTHPRWSLMGSLFSRCNGTSLNRSAYTRAVTQPSQVDEDAFLMEAEPGVVLALGEVAFRAGDSGASVTEDNIITHGNGGAGALMDEGYDYSGGVFDFVIKELSSAGQSVSVVVPQFSAIPEGAVYRKLSALGWQDFIIDENNSIASAPGEQGFCPPPGDEAYSEGLTADHWCVQLTIEDGGPNDADGEANYRIEDPSGVAEEAPLEITISKGGGGSPSLWLLALLGLFGAMRIKRRKLH